MKAQRLAYIAGQYGMFSMLPLTPEAEWPEVKDFAMRFSIALATVGAVLRSSCTSTRRRYEQSVLGQYNWLFYSNAAR